MSHPEALWLPPQEGGRHGIQLGGGRGRGLRGSGRGLCGGGRSLERDVAFILRNDLSDDHHSTDGGDGRGRHGRGQRELWEKKQQVNHEELLPQTVSRATLGGQLQVPECTAVRTIQSESLRL